MILRVLILLLALCIASCGGGGSGKKKPEPDGQTPTEAYLLGGNVVGLSGNLAIANGDETLTLNKEGSFAFAKKITKGSAYDVKIVALPQDQLCELRNSRNYIYRNRNDVVIECARLVERQINIALPRGYALTDLRLVSNFQALGGKSESPLAATNTMTLFENSFVSLRNTNNKILFLSFISSTSPTGFEVNSTSTAKALILLEPTLLAAIHDRGLTANQIEEAFFTAVDSNNDLRLLAEKIQSLVDNGGNLNDSSGQLTEALNRAVTYSATVIARIALSPANKQTAQADSAIRFTKITPQPVPATGIQLQLAKATNNTNALTLTALNSYARFVSIHSNAFTSQLIDPNSSLDITLPNGLASQQVLPVKVTGPGQLGNISADNIGKIQEASVATGISQSFLPSLNLLLGLRNSSQFNIQDCLSNETITKLRTNGNKLANASQMIANKAWYKFFFALNTDLRTQFVTAVSSSKVSPLEELYNCEKFGAGVMISSKKKYAIENTTDILAVLNSVYGTTYQDIATDLFATSKINTLAETIRISNAEQIWNLSNLLQLNITTANSNVLAGQETTFTASCKDPDSNTSVSCTVNWNFGQGITKTGTTVNHAFPTKGNYTISATAKDIDGAESTQTLTVNVLAFEPYLQLKNPAGDIIPIQGRYNFGAVAIDTTARAVFTLTNTGFADLKIDSISSSSSDLRIEGLPAIPLAPNASAQFSVVFQPTAATNYESTITIASNQPDLPLWSYKVSGQGVTSIAHWTVKDATTERSFNATRINTTYDNELKRLQIRVFASADNEYPQLRLLLKNYDVNTNDRGDGEYNLDDISQSESCLGFFATANDEATQFCTFTNGLADADKATGIVLITTGSIAGQKKTTFTFDGIARTCNNPTAGTCPRVEVSGEIHYNSNL